MRPIDADVLKAKYEQMLPEIGDGYHKETLQDVLFELEYAPTISPDEVRGVGKWTNKRTIEHDGEWWCTACGKEITIYMGKKREDRYKFCPNCGAKMEASG